MRAASVLCLALALAACAEFRWHKASVDPTELAADLSACRKLAQERTQRMWGTAPQPTVDPRFGPSGPSQADLRLQESQAVDACMRQRGYVLAPS